MPPRKPWLAGFLSFLSPGLGQLYALEPRRAMLAFLASFLGALALVVPVWPHAALPGLLLGFAGGLGVLAAIVVDAVRRARRTPLDAPRPAYDRWYVYLVLIFVIGYGVRVPLSAALKAHVVEAFSIPSGSMEPTLEIGDHLYVDKRRLDLGSLRHGDVVVFTSVEEPDLKIIKRVVGLPGDTLEMRGGVLWRNGRLVDEPYAHRADPLRTDDEPERAQMRTWQLAAYVGQSPADYAPDRQAWGPVRVPAGSFFVLGDNRDHAYDSRYWGFVPASHLYGRASTVYFSFDPEAPTAWPVLTAIRWRRLGVQPR